MKALAYRESTGADLPFVVDSWLSSFRTSHAAGLIAMDDWREVMSAQVLKLLARPGVRVIVAHWPGQEGTGADLVGWAAVEAGSPPLVQFVYVKDHYRRMGIARGLLRSAGLELGDAFDYAAKTPAVSRLRTKIPRARWNPLRARHKPKTPTPAEKMNVQEQER